MKIKLLNWSAVMLLRSKSSQYLLTVPTYVRKSSASFLASWKHKQRLPDNEIHNSRGARYWRTCRVQARWGSLQAALSHHRPSWNLRKRPTYLRSKTTYSPGRIWVPGYLKPKIWWWIPDCPLADRNRFLECRNVQSSEHHPSFLFRHVLIPILVMNLPNVVLLYSRKLLLSILCRIP